MDVEGYYESDALVAQAEGHSPAHDFSTSDRTDCTSGTSWSSAAKENP